MIRTLRTLLHRPSPPPAPAPVPVAEPEPAASPPPPVRPVTATLTRPPTASLVTLRPQRGRPCAWCGDPEPGHGRQWSPTRGFHGWEAPLRDRRWDGP